MKRSHDKDEKRPGRVAEPVQVYLESPDQQRLRRLVAQLGLTKSAVLRRGLEALERQLMDPARHPALQVIGIATEQAGSAPDYDVARQHDRYLADAHDRPRKPRKARGR